MTTTLNQVGLIHKIAQDLKDGDIEAMVKGLEIALQEELEYIKEVIVAEEKIHKEDADHERRMMEEANAYLKKRR